jgi:RNA polymerase sigma factor (sigma-70 family)
MKLSVRLEMFEEVRKQHGDFLASVLWKLTGDRELFAEALQYSLLEMWRHVEKLNGKQASTYIYRIALSANSKAWRNRIGRDGQLVRYQRDLVREHADIENRDEFAKKVRIAIAKLSRKQSQAVVMRYLQQKEYSELAEELNCSVTGARSHVSKALAALKEKLASYITEE